MANLFELPRIFNPDQPNRSTKLFGGFSSGIVNWNDIKHKVWHSLFKKLLGNFWQASEINLVDDTKSWLELNTFEREAFLKANAQLAALDSLQTPSVTMLMAYTSDSAFKQVLAIMVQQEAIHTEAYSVILSSLVPLEVQNKAFEEAKTNPLVLERNKFVLDVYQEFIENPTKRNALKFLVRCVVLEGIFFYSGFAYFYYLASKQKMMKSATMIQYIQRDEMQHSYGITQAIQIHIKDTPELDTEETYEYIRNTIREAVDMEYAWSSELLKDIPGIDLNEFLEYIEYLGNKRLRQMGLDNLWPDRNNPMPWISVYTDEMIEKTKTDFFENKERQYAKPDQDNGFDEL